MSRIQDDVNKMFKEKERQDLLVESIIEQRKHEFDVFLEEQMNNTEWTKEENEYINSIYYPEYVKYLNQLGNYVENLYKEMLFVYESKRINYGDAFFMGIKHINNIAEIGFPIPERFVELIRNTVKDKLEQISVIDDGIFEISVAPVEYTIVGSHNNIGKPIYSYQIVVELKRKMKENKQK